jgi:hypothetical protein
MATTIRDAYREFEEAHGSEYPIRTEDDLRSLIHACGLRYEEIDERFWEAVFDSAGDGDTSGAWAWNPEVPMSAAMKRYADLDPAGDAE